MAVKRSSQEAGRRGMSSVERPRLQASSSQGRMAQPVPREAPRRRVLPWLGTVAVGLVFGANYYIDNNEKQLGAGLDGAQDSSELISAKSKAGVRASEAKSGLRKSDRREQSLGAEIVKRALDSVELKTDFNGSSADLLLKRVAGTYVLWIDRDGNEKYIGEDMMLGLMLAETGIGENGSNVTAESYIINSKGRRVRVARGLMQFARQTQLMVANTWTLDEVKKMLPQTAMIAIEQKIEAHVSFELNSSFDQGLEPVVTPERHHAIEALYLDEFIKSDEAANDPYISWHLAAKLIALNCKDIIDAGISREENILDWAIVQYHSGKAKVLIYACRQAGIEVTPQEMFANKENPYIQAALRKIPGNGFKETEQHFNNYRKYLQYARQYLQSRDN